ncbi:hypothetical protein [Pseudonocardia sp. HH130630-07]|uniref:hypothetical protein n=1 Tax=Pseudonocardia sp. HH130630-07 TaxID=1690815 RepID=UPI000814CFF4|nr:hypothetical protein [Pseudonocardia sp. HH130630-07]ANY07747.1 hypothetical protein AFB00_17240 [Pseudonocardia sp. HH130630-07]
MLERLTQALADADASDAAATLHDDVTLRVAVHDRPFSGAAAAQAILEVVLDGPLHDVRPVEHFAAVPAAVTTAVADAGVGVQVQTFTAAVAGYPGRADGLLFARPAADGRIADLTVFLRPLPALAALAEGVGRRMGGGQAGPALGLTP